MTDNVTTLIRNVVDAARNVREVIKMGEISTGFIYRDCLDTLTTSLAALPDLSQYVVVPRETLSLVLDQLSFEGWSGNEPAKLRAALEQGGKK